MTSESIAVEISSAEAGQRLDRVLANRLGVPRNQVQQWILESRVKGSGKAVKSSYLVSAGEVFICDRPVRDLGRGIEPEEGSLDVLFEDSHLLILDKPAGLVVHPGAGHSQGTLVNRLLARCPEIAEVGGPGRPGIVHRLDKDTSGALIVARSASAYDALSRAFAAREIEKRYLAIVYGNPGDPSGRIDAPIGRHHAKRKEMAVRPGGRPAVTLYRTVAAASGIALLDVDLQTGRTHQIRVHLKSIGHPLVGDPVYGEARWKGLPGKRQSPLRQFPRPALHAWRLAFTHPVTQEPMLQEAPLPQDMRLLWEEVTQLPLPTLD